MEERDERAYSRRSLHLRADGLIAIQAKRRMRPMRRTMSRERRRFGFRQIPSCFLWMNLWFNLFEGLRKLKWDFDVFMKSLLMSSAAIYVNLIYFNMDWKRHRKSLWVMTATSFAIGFLISRFPLGYPVTERIDLVDPRLSPHARKMLAVIVPLDLSFLCLFIAASFYALSDEMKKRKRRVV